ITAASGNWHVEVVMLLLENRSDVTVADNYRWTPINAASGNRYIEVVKLLLQNGLDITATYN
ncbi:hypothetical protein EDB80DRAFT_517072, partial [Ilyonectria destructans]